MERKHGRKFIIKTEKNMVKYIYNKRINLLTNYNTRNPMEKTNLCFFVAARGSWP